MGLSKKKTTTESQGSAQTRPVAPQYAEAPIENYYSRANDLINNPVQVTVRDNNLQRTAYNDAFNLNNRSMDYTNVRGLVGDALGSNLDVGAPGVANVAGVDLPDPVLAKGGAIGKWDKAGGGFAGPVERIDAQSLLDGLDRYMNPATNAYVNTTLANYDNQAGKQQAAYARKGALNKAFGGSSYALGEADLLANQGRERGNLESGLRYTAFNNAADLSDRDTGRRQEAGMFNAGQSNQRDIVNAQLANQASIANMNKEADAAMLQAQLAQALGIANAGFANDFGLAGFNAQVGNNRQNASALNDALMALFGEQNANARFDRSSQLQGAALLGELLSAEGGEDRANLSLQQSIGNDQYQRDLYNQMAPYLQQQLLGDALNPELLRLLTGQDVNSEGSGTTTQSGGLLGGILGGILNIGAAAAGRG